MKRRAFLGFLGGAAAAGPATAQAMLTKGSLIGEGAGLSTGIYNGIGGPCVDNAKSDWRSLRIVDLKRFLSGHDPEFERRRKSQLLHSLETRERARLDSLRSVSFVNKMRLLAEGSLDRDERIRREQYRWELSDLLRETRK